MGGGGGGGRYVSADLLATCNMVAANLAAYLHSWPVSAGGARM